MLARLAVSDLAASSAPEVRDCASQVPLLVRALAPCLREPGHAADASAALACLLAPPTPAAAGEAKRPRVEDAVAAVWAELRGDAQDAGVAQLLQQVRRAVGSRTQSSRGTGVSSPS